MLIQVSHYLNHCTPSSLTDISWHATQRNWRIIMMPTVSPLVVSPSVVVTTGVWPMTKKLALWQLSLSSEVKKTPSENILRNWHTINAIWKKHQYTHEKYISFGRDNIFTADWVVVDSPPVSCYIKYRWLLLIDRVNREQIVQPWVVNWTMRGSAW